MDFKKLLKMFDNEVINEQVGPRSVSAVAQASGIADPNRIRPGQTINIPTAGGGMATTTVKPGDTLSGIIKRMQGQQNFRVATTPPTQGSKSTEPVTPVQTQTTPGGGPSKAAELAKAQGKEVPSATTTSPAATITTTTSPATAGGSVAKSKEIPTITTTAPVSTQSSMPTRPPGKGAQTDAFGTPTPAVAYADPEGTGSGAMPASDTEVRGGFDQPTNITRDTPDQIARRGPMGTSVPEPPRPAVDAQGNRLQTKGFVDTVKDVFTKSPAPPAAAGVQSPNPEQFGVKSFVPSSTKSSSGQTQSVPTDTGMEMRPLNTKTDSSSTFAEEELQDLEEELNEMLRLSGIALTEKAVSKQQQKFMGMVHAMQKGKKIPGASPELKKVAKTMGKKDAKDFASTKHKGLPTRVDEGLNLMLDEEGHTLEHIVNRFKHEAKTFLNTGEMSDKLYDALYDYYLDRGDMPYGIAKAREGDPYTWVAARFEADIDGTVDVKMPMDEVAGDHTLNELARLAGLSEGRVDECGDMGMDMEDRLNVSTNMSSDGTKSVNISAQGEKAEELLAMLKLAGMGSDRPVVAMIDRDEEMMEADRETEYANTPEEEYETVDRIIRQGNDLNREKKQFANMPKAGDNPMATDEMLDEELSALLDSVLVREVDPRRPKGDTGIADIYTADKGIPPPSPDEGPVAKTKAPAPSAPKAPVIAPGTKR